jgi:hypothetical protein
VSKQIVRQVILEYPERSMGHAQRPVHDSPGSAQRRRMRFARMLQSLKDAKQK